MLLFIGCGAKEDAINEPDSTMSESQVASENSDEPEPNAQVNPDGVDGTHVLKKPDDAEKAAIKDKYGLSEERYYIYWDLYEKGWVEATDSNSVTFEDYIAMMEEQTAAHEQGL